MVSSFIVIDNFVIRMASFGDFDLTWSNLIRIGLLSVGDTRFHAIIG